WPIPGEARDGPSPLPVAPDRPAIPRPPPGPAAQRIPPERRSLVVGPDPRRSPLHHPARRPGRAPGAVLRSSPSLRRGLDAFAQAWEPAPVPTPLLSWEKNHACPTDSIFPSDPVWCDDTATPDSDARVAELAEQALGPLLYPLNHSDSFCTL